MQACRLGATRWSAKTLPGRWSSTFPASQPVTDDISFVTISFIGKWRDFLTSLRAFMTSKKVIGFVIKESVDEVNVVSGSLTCHLHGSPGQAFCWPSGSWFHCEVSYHQLYGSMTYWLLNRAGAHIAFSRRSTLKKRSTLSAPYFSLYSLTLSVMGLYVIITQVNKTPVHVVRSIRVVR